MTSQKTKHLDRGAWLRGHAFLPCSQKLRKGGRKKVWESGRGFFVEDTQAFVAHSPCVRYKPCAHSVSAGLQHRYHSRLLRGDSQDGEGPSSRCTVLAYCSQSWTQFPLAAKPILFPVLPSTRCWEGMMMDTGDTGGDCLCFLSFYESGKNLSLCMILSPG